MDHLQRLHKIETKPLDGRQCLGISLAAAAPSWVSGSIAAGTTSYAASAKPLRSRLEAIGRPIRPSPIEPLRSKSRSPMLSRTLDVRVHHEFDLHSRYKQGRNDHSRAVGVRWGKVLTVDFVHCCKVPSVR